MDWLSPHVTLELESLAQGQVIALTREAIVKAQQDIVAFLRKHGEASKGASASVTLTLKFKIDNPAEAHIKITHSVKATPPTLPPGETSGFVENDGKGTKIMVVRGDTPVLDTSRQRSLFDGDIKFDQQTGEILNPPGVDQVELTGPSERPILQGSATPAEEFAPDDA